MWLAAVGTSAAFAELPLEGKLAQVNYVYVSGSGSYLLHRH
jgi:hypothetical protein